MPKGIETFLTLPADIITCYFQSPISWQSNDQPISLDIKFRAPDFKFMPKIDFEDVTGTLFLTFHDSNTEFNVFMNGFSYIEEQRYIANIEKEFRDDVYRAYLKNPQGSLSIAHL